MDFSKLHLSETLAGVTPKPKEKPSLEIQKSNKIDSTLGKPKPANMLATNITSRKQKRARKQEIEDIKKVRQSELQDVVNKLRKELEPLKKRRMSEDTKEYFFNLRREQELIHLREKNMCDWRQELQEEHPYVEVMPGGDDELDSKLQPKVKNDIINKKKRKSEYNDTYL
jgi:hypothetical protein